MKVFKVETVGDSCKYGLLVEDYYQDLNAHDLLFADVAVTGLPTPQPNHAEIMTRFAQKCLLKFNDVTKRLEVVLGPDTGDLKMSKCC